MQKAGQRKQPKRSSWLAGVAQLVEQRICNAQVAGSSPFASFSCQLGADFEDVMQPRQQTGIAANGYR